MTKAIEVPKEEEENEEEGVLHQSQHLEKLIVETLPTNEIVYAFAYGSGVFSQQPKQQQQPEQNQQQQQNDPNSRMVDLIIVVKDSFQFHLQNYRRNPMHYWTPPYWMIPLALPSSSLLHSQPERIRQQQQRKGTMLFGKQQQQQHEETLALWFTQLQRGLWKHQQQQPQTRRSRRGEEEEEGSEWDKSDTQSLWNGFWGGTYPTTTTTTFINPGVYFNLVNNNDNDNHNETNTISSFKYGIVQVEDLLDDLKHWNCLYLAGRMHKPIVPLSLLSSSSSFDHYSKQQQQQQWKTVIESYQQDNLIAALSTALLLLLSSSTQLSSLSSSTTTTTTTQRRRRSLQQSHKLQFIFSEQDIYRTIAELSYRGDYRIYASAEDPNKITNLISSPGQLQRFRNLYEPCWNHLIHELHLPLSLQQQQEQQSSPSKGFGNNKNKNRNKNDILNNNLLQTWILEVDNVDVTNPLSLSSSSSSPSHLLWSQLPTSIVPPNPHFSTSTTTTTTSSQQSKWLSNQLSMRVAASSQCQSIKGIVTVGPQKAYQYAIRKLIKGRRWSSWFRR